MKALEIVTVSPTHVAMAQYTEDLFDEDVDSEDEDWVAFSYESYDVPQVGEAHFYASRDSIR